jgi:RimJ/RimL family protein N-acetyltransferase
MFNEMFFEPVTHKALKFLWKCLKERLKEPNTNISHHQMPAPEAHEKFVGDFVGRQRSGHPYAYWYVITIDAKPIGVTYITRENEIGIFIAKKYRGFGRGRQALRLLMDTHKLTHFKANINPLNERSIRLFMSLGFALISESAVQNCYMLVNRRVNSKG